MGLETDKAEAGSESSEADMFEAAFREHWGLVYRVIFRLVGDRPEAEDLALETFWRLHQKMRRHPGMAPVRGWLCRVAANLGLNALRSGRRRVRYEDAAARGISQNRAGGDPHELAARAEEQRMVRLVLSRIKPRSARLLSLRHSGFSYAELAEALQIPVASIGSLLARAQKEFEREFRALELEQKKR